MNNNQPIRFSIAPCALGYLLVAATAKGICAVALSDPQTESSPDALEANLRRQFPSAEFHRNDADLQPWMEMLIEHLEGRRHELNLPLDVQGTEFQQRVWQALRDIPYGETRTYTEIA